MINKGFLKFYYMAQSVIYDLINSTNILKNFDNFFKTTTYNLSK